MYMGFFGFKTKQEKQLDAIMARIDMNMSNNYKDAAQEGFAELKKAIDELAAQQIIPQKKLDEYISMYDSYAIKLKGFTHKDQKPYWS